MERRYAGVLLAFAAALACKQMFVTLPFVLLLLDYWPLARARSRRLVLEKLPLFALSAAACAVVLTAQEIPRTRAPELALGLRLAHAAVAPFRYLALALWPSPLSVLYPHPYAPELGGEPWATSTVVVSIVGLVAITAAVLAARRRPYLAVGWLWFLGTLVPVIGLVQVGPQGVADRYTYVPLIGPFIAFAWGARDAIAALGAGRPAVRIAAATLTGCALVAAATGSHARARVWRDSESLYRDSLAATPHVLLYNLKPGADPGAAGSRRRRGPELAALAIDTEHLSATRQPRQHPTARPPAGSGNRAIAHYRAALRPTLTRSRPSRTSGACSRGAASSQRRLRNSSAQRGSPRPIPVCAATWRPRARHKRESRRVRSPPKDRTIDRVYQ